MNMTNTVQYFQHGVRLLLPQQWWGWGSCISTLSVPFGHGSQGHCSNSQLWESCWHSLHDCRFEGMSLLLIVSSHQQCRSQMVHTNTDLISGYLHIFCIPAFVDFSFWDYFSLRPDRWPPGRWKQDLKVVALFIQVSASPSTPKPTHRCITAHTRHSTRAVCCRPCWPRCHSWGTSSSGSRWTSCTATRRSPRWRTRRCCTPATWALGWDDEGHWFGSHFTDAVRLGTVFSEIWRQNREGYDGHEFE